jgi:hypothetical protein
MLAVSASHGSIFLLFQSHTNVKSDLKCAISTKTNKKNLGNKVHIAFSDKTKKR